MILGPDTRIVAAIELDDATHTRPERRDADARKAHALSSAGIPLLRWSPGQLPDLATIRSAVEAIASGAASARHTPEP